jgi:hypothetical protein
MYVLLLCTLPLLPTCVLVMVNEMLSYSASTVDLYHFETLCSSAA